MTVKILMLNVKLIEQLDTVDEIVEAMTGAPPMVHEGSEEHSSARLAAILLELARREATTEVQDYPQDLKAIAQRLVRDLERYLEALRLFDGGGQ